MLLYRGGLLVVKVGHHPATSLERGRSLLEGFLYREGLLLVTVRYHLEPSLERGRNLLESFYTWEACWLYMLVTV